MKLGDKYRSKKTGNIVSLIELDGMRVKVRGAKGTVLAMDTFDLREGYEPVEPQTAIPHGDNERFVPKPSIFKTTKEGGL